MGSPYTPQHDEQIRSLWPDHRAVASMLGRTDIAVKARARKLGLPSPTGEVKRPFTAVEEQAVRDRYPAEGAVQLAREFGRTRGSIVNLAERLGIRFNGLRPWTADEDRQLVEMTKAGKGLRAIAEQLGRTHAAIGKRRETLGIAKRVYDPKAHRDVLVSPRVPTLVCETRWARVRIAMGEHGWPPDLNPKEIAVLDSLRTAGPQSRQRLSLSIGEPASRSPHKRLMTHGGRSAMGRLLARGLVARLSLFEGRKRVAIYTLTATAAEQWGKFGSVRTFNESAANRGRKSA